MNFLVLIGVLGTGLLAGSFLNLVSDRLKRKENFITGRSRCDFCSKDLKSLDLIPVISYLINKGRCAYCLKNLSPIYPLSEILTAIFFAFIYYFLQINNLGWEYYLYFYFNFSLLIIIFWYDYKFYEIPFKVVVLGSVSSFILRAMVLKNLTLENLLIEVASWLGIFLFYYLIIWVSKGGMGGGDLKLSVYLGIFLGFPTSIYGIYYGFVLGGIFALILLILKKKSLKAKIPFGPFLIIGSLISLFLNY
jgi:prepilin signal peptidase PulO-like enzyme (type II secretory pathway)